MPETPATARTGRGGLERVTALLAGDFPALDLRLSEAIDDVISGVARAVVVPARERTEPTLPGLDGFAFPDGTAGAGFALLFAADDDVLRAVRRFYLPPVVLAGAGPGGVGTMTVAASRAVAKADVVLADCLCGDEVLTFMKPGAECVPVGKRGDGPSVKQEDINRRIATDCLAGKRVVRLKGGDPSVFGRLEEEIDVLRGLGVAYRVIPGVGSASAAAALAGQPLTVREIASEVIFSTGRLAGGGRNIFPLKDGAAPSICLYMSRRVLAERMADLVAAGYPEETPVIVGEKIGSPAARATAGTIGTIAAIADRENVGTPAVVLVGRQYRKPDHLPLAGVTVWLPAEEETGISQREELAELGAVTVNVPLIEPRPLPIDEGAVFARLDGTTAGSTVHGGPFDWVVFTSKKGVDFFFSLLEKWGLDSRWMPKVAAIGDPAFVKLRARGIRPNLFPPEPTRVALSTSLIQSGIRGKRVLLPMSAVAPDVLPERLREAGADVHRLDLYTLAFPEVTEVPEADVVLFSSESTVRSARDQGLLAGIRDRGMIVGGIGPATWRRLDEVGLPPAIRPDGTSPAALARALRRHFASLEIAAAAAEEAAR